jgi:outer membrane protein assembly factor BamB
VRMTALHPFCAATWLCLFALDGDTGEVIATLRGPHVGGAALIGRRWIAIGCDAGQVYLLDRKSGLPIWTFETSGSIRSTPDARSWRIPCWPRGPQLGPGRKRRLIECST